MSPANRSEPLRRRVLRDIILCTSQIPVSHLPSSFAYLPAPVEGHSTGKNPSPGSLPPTHHKIGLSVRAQSIPTLPAFQSVASEDTSSQDFDHLRNPTTRPCLNADPLSTTFFEEHSPINHDRASRDAKVRVEYSSPKHSPKIPTIRDQRQ